MILIIVEYDVYQFNELANTRIPCVLLYSMEQLVLNWVLKCMEHKKDAHRTANSVDPDQTAPYGAV